jgi:hypothetical protein
MAKQTFGSFKELLIKRELSDENAKRDVRTEVLAKIFRYVQSEIILSNVQHFSVEDQAAIDALLQDELLRDRNSKVTISNAEAIVNKGLASLDAKTKALLCDLLEEEAKVAQKEHKRIEKLSAKFHPNDPGEELADLKARIKEIQLDIVDIEMSMMTLENDGRQESEPFKKAKNARERRKQLISRLQKQIQGVQKKLEKKN